MAKLKLDNPFFNAMGRIGDVVLLNVTWAVCCLPLVTVGASTTALLYTARRMAAGEECRVWRDFFRAFRRNWRQAALLWLVLAAAGVLFIADVVIAFQTPGAVGNLFRGTGLALCLLWLVIGGNAFALLARYEYTLGRVLGDACRLALHSPASAGITVVMAAWLPLLGLADLNAALYLLPLWLLAGGSLWALCLSAVLLPAFRKLEEGA